MTLPRNVDDLFQLAPMQHLMLLHAIAEEGSGVLLNQVGYDITGPLDVESFRGAWEALVARHPALRTAFLWEGLPHPVQAVRSSVPLDFTVTDLTALPPDGQARSADALQRADAQAPLSLSRAPLMRCTLLRLGEAQHRFLWTIHHLVVDRWSSAVLLRELCALYVARTTGSPAPLPPAPRYRDYVGWIAQQDREGAERYWRGELGDFREASRLGGPRASRRPGARATTMHVLSGSESAAVREGAARWRTTPGAVLQSAIGLLLARRSARGDVAFGLTVSGRPPDLADVSRTVGSFVNNVPVRLRLVRAQTVESVVREVHRAEGRRLPFTYVSPVQIQDWSAVPAGQPLFDTLVLINLGDEGAVEWPGLQFTSTGATLDAGYPLLLAVGVVSGTYTLSLVHDASFDDAAPLLSELADLVQRVATAESGSCVADLIPSLVDAPARMDRDAGISASAFPHAGDSSAAVSGEALATALLQAWREVLGIDELGLDDDFLAVGGSSLQAAQLFARIERIAGKALPLSTLFHAGSVRAMLGVLERPVPRSGSLVRMRSGGSRPTLYAVPGIGGNIVGLSGLARHLGPEQPFSAFESPGLDGREAPLTSIEAIAARYADELLRAEPGPMHLVGICWGAAVIFEMGRLLRARGRPPASLALMDPAVLLRESSQEHVEPSFMRERLELYWDEFRAGSWRDRSRLLASKARRAAQALAGGEARERGAHERALFRVREANTLAVTRYIPQPYEGVARLFLTTDRDVGAGDDPRLEWLTLIAPQPSVVPIAGINSGDAISPAHVAGFAAALRSWLDAAPAGVP